MLFLENIKIALSSIKANKMRSFLTMLGIIIGISSVIAITSIGASAQALVSKEFDSYGKNMMYIYINWYMIDDYIEYKDWIFNDEIDQLKERFGSDIQYAGPSTYSSSDVKVGRVSGKVEMNGVAEDYNKSKNMNMLYGRMINETDVKSARENIVIEKAAAVELFNRVDVTGEVLNLNVDGENRDMTIVGVFEVERTIFSQLSSGTYEAYVPYPLLQNMAGDGVSSLEVYVDPNLSTEAMAEKISNYLCLIKDQEPGFYTYETAEGQGAIMDSMLGTLSMAIGAIAAISLLVGGIGIMNIMLVSVTERTREIGVRKSLGARTKDILQQFLIESMILSAIGGAIGVLLGTGVVALGVFVISAAGTDGIEMVISPAVVAMAVGFSALVGVCFGLFPARKAAKLDPIEALRYE